MNDELKNWADDSKKMIHQTAQVDGSMHRLKTHLHASVIEHLFKIFPFLPDRMDASEIRLLGERIHRHLNTLGEELTNIAYTVEKRGKGN